jgi:hypothetical protein
MIGGMRIAQDGKRHTRWDVVSKFKEFHYGPRNLLFADIDKGPANSSLFGKLEKNRARFDPVLDRCALVELKAQEPPLLVAHGRGPIPPRSPRAGAGCWGL